MAGEQRIGMTKPVAIETAAAAASPPAPAMLTPAHDTMRRLQIGVAGLLSVLLLVGLAGVIGDRARESATKSAAAPDKASGRETGRERECPKGEVSVVADALKK